MIVDIAITEMFYRLFRASWLPGQDTVWRIVTGYPAYRLPDLPFDGVVLDILAFVLVLLLIDWILKACRRYV